MRSHRPWIRRKAEVAECITAAAAAQIQDIALPSTAMGFPTSSTAGSTEEIKSDRATVAQATRRVAIIPDHFP